MDSNTDVSLESAKQYIDSIDFTNIINKLAHHKGWRRKDAIAISKMYKKFLYLQKKYSSQYSLPPLEEIDEFWHNHILDTKMYKKDCKAIFGEYLEHYPYFGIDDNSNIEDLHSAFRNTTQLYEQEFNAQLTKVRNRFDGFMSLIRRRTNKLTFRGSVP